MITSQHTADSAQHTADQLEVLRPEADVIVAQYERKQAAILPVLHLVQQRLADRLVQPVFVRVRFAKQDVQAAVVELHGSSPLRLVGAATLHHLAARC